MNFHVDPYIFLVPVIDLWPYISLNCDWLWRMARWQISLIGFQRQSIFNCSSVKTWFAVYLKQSQLSSSKSIGAWVCLPVSTWENTVLEMCHFLWPHNWHSLEMVWHYLSIKLVCLNIQCWIPGMIYYIIHLCSYRDKYEASFSALWRKDNYVKFML